MKHFDKTAAGRLVTIPPVRVAERRSGARVTGRKPICSHDKPHRGKLCSIKKTKKTQKIPSSIL